MKTKQGTSRRFGFIGYKTEAAAEAAINYFNNTFINTSRIVVEKAIAYRSEELPRPWSKYTPGSSAHEKKEEDRKQKKSKKNDFEVEETDAFRAKQKKNEKTEELINQLNADKSDPKLKEYLEVMMPRSKGKTWGNDDVAPSTEAEKQKDEEDTVVVQHNESDDEYQDLPMNKKKAHKEDEDVEMEDSSAQVVENDVNDDPMDTDKESEKPKDPKDSIAETGRLFVRNLTYACTEDDLKQMFEKYGTLSEVHMPIAKDTKKSKGYAYISYMLPEHAVKAYEALDMKTFQGRLLHIIPGEEKPPTKEEEIVGVNGTKLSSVKKEKEKKRRNLAGNDFNWNSLYMSADAIAESIADRLGISKSDVLNADANNMAVRLALAETQIVNETKEFFEKHGIVLDSFGKKERSETIILVKNIPYGTTEDEMRELFGKYGELGRVLMPPAKTIAVVEFLEPSEARNAFKALAYRRFKDSLIYLEKAPSGLFKDKFVRGDAKQDKKEEKEEEIEQKPKSATELLGADEDNANDDITSVFVKNLNFNTTIESLRNAFKGIEGYRSSRINVKPDPKNPGKTLSMGYGFIEFNNKANAEKAIKAMQGYMLDDHALDLKLSHHKTSTSTKKSKTPDTTKIIVRNVPFEATAKDLRELFSAYGQLKSLRLPKKFTGGHRGFAFLDFMTKQEAKNVYDNMANIHLYGRHLVLEWAKEEDKASENLLDASRKRRREESDDFVPL
ncbi:Multiple RNA-binding domain-containing protein 1 [Rhizopus azygosporus]|uniref:Multiple RNA-binding domain-containing protein 1 n=1 Tax=Rhizopus azygosporus TaxID=86630 RepID=A0A367KGG4_RHIAZ|nr:Multiple RNA-binding domain-containing protein 1 [Rhizopus azygosporus]